MSIEPWKSLSRWTDRVRFVLMKPRPQHPTLYAFAPRSRRTRHYSFTSGPKRRMLLALPVKFRKRFPYVGLYTREGRHLPVAQLSARLGHLRAGAPHGVSRVPFAGHRSPSGRRNDPKRALWRQGRCQVYLNDSLHAYHYMCSRHTCYMCCANHMH